MPVASGSGGGLSSKGSTPVPFSRYLDTNGDGTGSKNAIGDYSSSATRFYLRPAAGQIFRVCHLITSLCDVGAFTDGAYGNGITLSNGIFIRMADGDDVVSYDLTDGLPILYSSHWGRYAAKIDTYNYGASNEHLLVDIDLLEHYGTPVRLVGDNGDYLEVVLNDNFSGLVEHYFLGKGYREIG